MNTDQTLLIGKISPKLLKEIVFERLGHSRKEVVLTPSIGEDSAALDLGNEFLLISTDPITGAQDKAGWLAVKVAINDIAAAGGEPICILVTLLLPENSLLSDLQQIIDDINDACLEEKIQVAGGHTEVTQGLKQPIISVTAVGKTKNRKILGSSNAQIGDDIVMTKWAGLGGTSILVRDFQEVFEDVLESDLIDEAKEMLSLISVTLEGKLAVETGANACHDATEGGIFGAVYEMCESSGLGAIIYADKIPVLPVTLKVAEFCKIDPFRLISSGSLIVSVSNGKKLCDVFKKAGINAAIIGKIVSKSREVVQSGNKFRLSSSGTDHLWYARKYLKDIVQNPRMKP